MPFGEGFEFLAPLDESLADERLATLVGEHVEHDHQGWCLSCEPFDSALRGMDALQQRIE
jgi:hypothetical protein